MSSMYVYMYTLNLDLHMGARRAPRAGRAGRALHRDVLPRRSRDRRSAAVAGRGLGRQRRACRVDAGPGRRAGGLPASRAIALTRWPSRMWGISSGIGASAMATSIRILAVACCMLFGRFIGRSERFPPREVTFHDDRLSEDLKSAVRVQFAARRLIVEVRGQALADIELHARIRLGRSQHGGAHSLMSPHLAHRCQCPSYCCIHEPI